METAEVIQQAKKLRERLHSYSTDDFNHDPGKAAKAQLCEFLRHYGGPNNSFLAQAEEADGHASYLVPTLVDILVSFVEYLEAGLTTGMSPRREAQLDVVTDLLEQAAALVDTSEFHPGAAAVLIGASLEEFLRNWAEEESLAIENRGIAAYASGLRSADLITKQDIKDLTAWAGIRNSAAHGEWDDVSDRDRIRLMLEGVNLFMRKYVP